VGLEALMIQLTQDAQNQAQAHSATQLQMHADYIQKIYLLDCQHKELRLAYDTAQMAAPVKSVEVIRVTLLGLPY
jgi:hypothetical protein